MAEASETLAHPVFGALGWLPKYSHWFTQLRQPSGDWQDVIVDPGDGDRHDFIEPAAGQFRWALDNERRVLSDAVQAKLLGLYNNTWRQGDEPELTAEGPAARLDWQLLVISNSKIVPIEFSYGAGKLFGCHGVTVEVDAAATVPRHRPAGAAGPRGQAQTFWEQTPVLSGWSGPALPSGVGPERHEVMRMRRDKKPEDCCVLNGGGGAWAFAALARQLSAALWVDVSETPREYNYLLHLDAFEPGSCGELFIPFRSMQVAADKRLLAGVFAAAGVPTPATRLVDSPAEAERLLADEPGREWCLKFPTGCGASGHRLLRPGLILPKDWPLPLVVQEFVRLEQPEVYRLYGVAGQLFGWVARRFPPGTEPSPWVAHARGARYEPAGKPPTEAVAAARAALEAVGLIGSFGCVDLLHCPGGAWVVLEVGTDGMFNHVDRDLGLPDLESEIQRRVAKAFWSGAGRPPWGQNAWRARETVEGE